MSVDKILSGESSDKSSDGLVIGSDGLHITSQSKAKASSNLSLHDRIAMAIESGGLEELPEDFDDENGDWKIINSINPFEILYLDYKQYKFISPELVKKHYALLDKFWKKKYEIMNTGGNRVAFKSKYGDGIIENCLTTIKRAYEKLNSTDGIQSYFTELNNSRLQKGEEGLNDSIEHMMLNGSADRAEILLCFERGLKHDLTNEESAIIVNKKLENLNFKPYGTVSGNNLIEKLLSVDSWMTEAKIKEAENIKRERESLKIQILPGKYASTIEEIGTILFDEPAEAKEIIKEDLLKQVIAQKDIVLAREISSITTKSKDPNTVFFQIVYKLNKTLPFPFINGQRAKDIHELTSMIFLNEQSIKSGKEDLKKGYIEIWLNETDKPAHSKLISIRDGAENFEQAFLAVLYSFNPELPYRFAGSILVNNIFELSVEINNGAANWNAGKAELYNGSIITWMQNTGKADIGNKWNGIKGNFKTQDIGLEEFLHLLNDKTAYAQIHASLQSIEYPKIQSGNLIQTEIIFNLDGRGYAEANFSFSKTLDGVKLSQGQLIFNAAAEQHNKSISLSIDSAVLLKGVEYKTDIVINTSANQQIEIPVTFKIVFPKNAFIIEIAKYAVIVAAFFVLIRLIISTDHPSWLNDSFNYFLNADQAFAYRSNFALFGWVFFLFLIISSSGIYFLTKYLRNGNK